MTPDAVPTPVDPALVADRIAEVEERLRAASGGRTRLLPVTKAFGVDAVRAVMAAGHRAVGENYAQELLGKALELKEGEVAEAEDAQTAPAVEWHMIGGVQRKKVRQLGPLVSLWQTVDRVSLVDELAKRVPGASILVQVDPAESPAKGGCPPGDVTDLVERATDGGLVVAGLMTVGVQDDPAATSDCFATVARLAADLGLAELSMGMTDDLDLAVDHGSTLVRVGRALFGDRPPRPGA